MKSRTKILILFAAASFGLNVFSSNPADPNNSGPALVAKVLKENRSHYFGEPLATSATPTVGQPASASSFGLNVFSSNVGTPTEVTSAPSGSTSTPASATPTVGKSASNVMPIRSYAVKGGTPPSIPPSLNRAYKNSGISYATNPGMPGMPSTTIIPITGIAPSNQSGYYCPVMNIAQLTDGTSNGKSTYFQVTGEQKQGGVLFKSKGIPFAQYQNPKWTGQPMPGGPMKFVKLYGIELSSEKSEVKNTSSKNAAVAKNESSKSNKTVAAKSTKSVSGKKITGIGSSWDGLKGKYNQTSKTASLKDKDGKKLLFNNIIEVPKNKGGIFNPDIAKNKLVAFAQYQKKNNLVTLYGSLNTDDSTIDTAQISSTAENISSVDSNQSPTVQSTNSENLSASKKIVKSAFEGTAVSQQQIEKGAKMARQAALSKTTTDTGKVMDQEASSSSSRAGDVQAA